MHIAIVEDEPKLASLLKNYLAKEGYTASVYGDGSIALDSLRSNMPDLVLLDLMLPGLDGLSICRELRKISDVPLIMITARVEEIDRLLGLEIGADDYICKPYSPREVVARVKTVLRRTTRSDDAQPDSRFVLNDTTASVSIDGQETTLTAVELQLLKVMSDKPGQIFGRAQLMGRIYRDGRIVSDRTIDSHIKKLRQKLSALNDAVDCIHSVYGIGYKFELAEES
ncbi:MAG: response regulator [Granulosicoccaceae bacterium]